MNIKEFRLEKNLTQSGVAQAIGTSSKNIWAWENGLANPSIDMLIKLADLFGVSLDALAGRYTIKDSLYFKMDMDDEEKEFLIKFRCLNKQKQLKTLGYMDALGEKNEQNS